MQKLKKQQRGVTIVELMIAIVISSVIMLGIGTVYSSTKRSNIVQEEFARMQENGRFALNYIARFVREAGYAGCASGLNNLVSTLNNSDDDPWQFNTGLEGYEATGTAPGETLGTALAEYPTVSSTPANWTATLLNTTPYADFVDGSDDAVIPHSDILVARSVDGSGVEVSDPKGSANIQVNNTGSVVGGCPDGSDMHSGICIGDILIVSDCTKSIAFQATNVGDTAGGTKVLIVHSTGSNPGNDETSWGGSSGNKPELHVEEGAEMMVVSTKTFYIGSGTSGPALFMKQGNDTGQELVEGVENMQVLYGEDTDLTNPDNIPDHYVPADQVADFANVVSVRVTLLLRSVNEIPHRADNAEDKIVGGTTAATGVTLTTPTDKRMRHIMSMTIKLRNRAFSI